MCFHFRISLPFLLLQLGVWFALRCEFLVLFALAQRAFCVGVCLLRSYLFRKIFGNPPSFPRPAALALQIGRLPSSSDAIGLWESNFFSQGFGIVHKFLQSHIGEWVLDQLLNDFEGHCCYIGAQQGTIHHVHRMADTGS